MEKKYLSLAVLLLSVTSVSAQHTNKTTVYIQPGVEVYLAGNTVNDVAGTIVNDGVLHIQRDFQNLGVAQINNLVKIDGGATQSINGVSEFQTLEVDKTAGVATVTGGETRIKNVLRLNSGTINSNGNMVIMSTATGTGLVDDFSNAGYDGQVTGNLRVQRLLSPFAKFHYIGSPVNNPPMTELSEMSLFGVNNAQIIASNNCSSDSVGFGSPYGWCFEWREAGPFNTNCMQWGWYVRNGGNLQNARGYSLWKQNPGNQTLEISGVANTSEVTNVTLNGLQNTNAVGLGWQLVSNPFPSPMVWNNIPAGFNGQAHFFNGTPSTHQGTYQPILPGPAQLIPSMQGFFVRVTAGPANFTLTQNHRSLGDPTFHKMEFEDYFELEVIGEKGNGDITVIRFGEEWDEMTNGFDEMKDANKLYSTGEAPTIYTLLNNEMYSINSLNVREHPMTVPLGLKPGYSGSYTITAKGLENLFAESRVWLEDLKEKKIQELTADASYEFSMEQDEDENRFLVHFRLEQTTDTDENRVSIYSYGTDLNVLVSGNVQNGELRVLDMAGRVIATRKGEFSGKTTIDLSNVAKGAYTVKAVLNDRPYVQKVSIF